MKISGIKIGLIPFLVLILLITLGACNTIADISPAPSAVLRNNYAVAEDGGIHVEIDPDAWKGDPQIKTRVTPILVKLENNSGKLLRFSADDFVFIDSSTGKKYFALPMYEIRGTIEKPVIVEGYSAVPNPYFFHRGFRVAPYYHPVYPHISPFEGPFFYDPLYYHERYTYWVNIKLPTREMYEHALPDGILDPGGRIEGFLYFQKVDPQPGKIQLNVKFHDEQKVQVGEVNIPFEVHR